jgi:hypothetical protein
VVRAVHEFDLKFVIKETPENGDQCKEGHAVKETRVIDGIFIIIANVVTSIKGLYPRCGGQMQSLE